MKRMLINATHSEEIRVALADGQKLYNLDIDVPGEERKKGNIYKGKITRVEPSLEAAFVDYGANRHGFLPYKEISRNYYTVAANKAKERPPINKAIKEGTEVIIQVVKEERGNKGAAITTYISLAGRYLVYMPENPKAGGISRRIEGKARQNLKDTLSKVNQPKNSGIIVRTAGIGRSAEELDWDINYLDQVWTAIKTVSANRKAPFFIYQESDIFIRALRDYLRPDVGEILIDNKEIYEKARDFMQQVMPHNLKKLSYYNDTIPLFSRYQIERQIQSAFAREVHLPSGGSIVIDHTEAMISIDINSARATKGADIEETALNTNLEAADEIARQLRIRDLGGLVVIDFIDMRNSKNQKSVEQQLEEAVSSDRARIQTTQISKFGLLEMSRQRLKSSINEASQFPCPRCSGHGSIRNIESLSVSILRILEEEAMKPGTGKVIAQVPTKVANFIINDKREELLSLEKRHSVPMYIIANEHYQSPQFDITRLKKSEAENFDIDNIVLNKPESEEEAENKSTKAQQFREKAAVDNLVPDSQVPTRATDNALKTWFLSLFTSDQDGKKVKAKTHKPKQHNKQKQRNNNPTNKRSNTAKPQARQPQNRQRNKQNSQQNKAAQNKPKQQKYVAQKPKQQVQKPTQKPKAQQQKTKQVANTPDNQVVNEEILQRPLGSVASYAAKKAQTPKKNEGQITKTVESAKPNKSNELNNIADKAVAKKSEKVKSPAKSSANQTAKTQAKKSESKQVEQKKPESKKAETTKIASTKPTLTDTSDKIKQEKPIKIKPEQEKISKTAVAVAKAKAAKDKKVQTPKDTQTKADATVVKKQTGNKKEKPVKKIAVNNIAVNKKMTETNTKVVNKEQAVKSIKNIKAKLANKAATIKSTEKPKPIAKSKQKIPDPTSHIDFDI